MFVDWFARVWTPAGLQTAQYSSDRDAFVREAKRRTVLYARRQDPAGALGDQHAGEGGAGEAGAGLKRPRSPADLENEPDSKKRPRLHDSSLQAGT